MLQEDRTLYERAVQVTRASVLFDATANQLLERVRRAMGIPANADAATEGAMLSLREKLDAHFPEFCELYGALLLEQLGPDAVRILDGLAEEDLQIYFRAAEAVRRELRAALPELAVEMTRAAYVGRQ